MDIFKVCNEHSERKLMNLNLRSYVGSYVNKLTESIFLGMHYH